MAEQTAPQEASVCGICEAKLGKLACPEASATLHLAGHAANLISLAILALGKHICPIAKNLAYSLLHVSPLRMLQAQNMEKNTEKHVFFLTILDIHQNVPGVFG